MSDALSIAAVSATLRNLLAKELQDVLPNGNHITTRPLDKAREEFGEAKQVNLFLYQTMANAALRNMDMPRRVRAGETGHPPLALCLYYLLTAYGESDDDLRGDGHLLLGRAMSILHDHAVLSPEEIQSALPSSDLSTQVERIRITPQSLSLDEISKLWNAFQTQYRISAAYQVSVVLIDSTRPTTAPLPVLARGTRDQGVTTRAQASPALTQIRLPRGKSGAELGDELILRGSNLADGDLQVRLEHRLLSEPLTLQPTPKEIVVEGRNEIALSVQLPTLADDAEVPGHWPIGFYALSVLVNRPDVPPWTTNALSFALVPTTELTAPVGPPTPPEVLEGDLPMTLQCVPQVREEQRVELLFGNRVIAPSSISIPPDATTPSQLDFNIIAAKAGTYVLRVRVDGVDSIPVDFEQSPPRFDPEIQITVRQP